MIYKLSYICAPHADDDYYYGGKDYVFEADTDEEAEELARIDIDATNKKLYCKGWGDHILFVHVSTYDLPKAKDKIAELKKELEI